MPLAIGIEENILKERRRRREGQPYRDISGHSWASGDNLTKKQQREV